MDRGRAAAAAGALLALAACFAGSAAAPTAGNQTALDLYDESEGCYYNFRHYAEGDRIMTNEPCLNCTCHNRMLMCYLRVCPFTKPIGQDCTVEKRADQCCPIVTCPDVPVDLLTSTSTSSPAEYGSTGMGKLDKYGCSINGKYLPEGSKVPPSPNKPCEHCYCIRNMTTCVMQECTLHVEGCTPIYHKDVCCPVRYSCDHSEDEIPLLDDKTTTVRPTPGFLLTTTTSSPVTQMTQDCVHDEQIFPDGALIKTEKACEHCYCMKGDIVCVVQECGTPMENEGKNCTSLPPRHGQCCPDTYICEGDELPSEPTTDFVTKSYIEEKTTTPSLDFGTLEGSGYEPDIYTSVSPLSTKTEGSGEEEFVKPTDMSQTPLLLDELFTTKQETFDSTSKTSTLTEEELTTEPDRGLNTVPHNEEATRSSMLELTTRGEEITATEQTILAGKYSHPTESTVSDISSSSLPANVTQKEEENVMTTEKTFRKEDEGTLVIENSTRKQMEDKLTVETVTSQATTLIVEGESQSTSELPEHKLTVETVTSQATTLIVEQESQSTSELPEHSSTVASKELTTESASDTEPNIKPEILDVTTMKHQDSQTDILSTTSSPSRIPGEGDCLSGGVTYKNNSEVPKQNHCQLSCKCISSVIKCDEVNCNPPPEFMNNCQSIYDSPESCCPTYVCPSNKTIPPQPHSQISGTEEPVSTIPGECNDDECQINKEKTQTMVSDACASGNCLGEGEKPDMTGCKNEENCKKVEISETAEVPCEGNSCLFNKSPNEEECKEENGCKKSIDGEVPEECTDKECRRNGIPSTENELPVSHTPETSTSRLSTSDEFKSTLSEVLVTEKQGSYTTQTQSSDMFVTSQEKEFDIHTTENPASTITLHEKIDEHKTPEIQISTTVENVFSEYTSTEKSGVKVIDTFNPETETSTEITENFVTSEQEDYTLTPQTPEIHEPTEFATEPHEKATNMPEGDEFTTEFEASTVTEVSEIKKQETDMREHEKVTAPIISESEIEMETKIPYFGTTMKQEVSTEKNYTEPQLQETSSELPEPSVTVSKEQQFTPSEENFIQTTEEHEVETTEKTDTMIEEKPVTIPGEELPTTEKAAIETSTKTTDQSVVSVVHEPIEETSKQPERLTTSVKEDRLATSTEAPNKNDLSEPLATATIELQSVTSTQESSTKSPEQPNAIIEKEVNPEETSTRLPEDLVTATEKVHVTTEEGLGSKPQEQFTSVTEKHTISEKYTPSAEEILKMTTLEETSSKSPEKTTFVTEKSVTSIEETSPKSTELPMTETYTPSAEEILKTTTLEETSSKSPEKTTFVTEKSVTSIEETSPKSTELPMTETEKAISTTSSTLEEEGLKSPETPATPTENVESTTYKEETRTQLPEESVTAKEFSTTTSLGESGFKLKDQVTTVTEEVSEFTPIPETGSKFSESPVTAGHDLQGTTSVEATSSKSTEQPTTYFENGLGITSVEEVTTRLPEEHVTVTDGTQATIALSESDSVLSQQATTTLENALGVTFKEQTSTRRPQEQSTITDETPGITSVEVTTSPEQLTTVSEKLLDTTYEGKVSTQVPKEHEITTEEIPNVTFVEETDLKSSNLPTTEGIQVATSSQESTSKSPLTSAEETRTKLPEATVTDLPLIEAVTLAEETSSYLPEKLTTVTEKAVDVTSIDEISTKSPEALFTVATATSSEEMSSKLPEQPTTVTEIALNVTSVAEEGSKLPEALVTFATATPSEELSSKLPEQPTIVTEKAQNVTSAEETSTILPVSPFTNAAATSSEEVSTKSPEQPIIVTEKVLDVTTIAETSSILPESSATISEEIQNTSSVGTSSNPYEESTLGTEEELHTFTEETFVVTYPEEISTKDLEKTISTSERSEVSPSVQEASTKVPEELVTLTNVTPSEDLAMEEQKTTSHEGEITNKPTDNPKATTEQQSLTSPEETVIETTEGSISEEKENFTSETSKPTTKTPETPSVLTEVSHPRITTKQPELFTVEIEEETVSPLEEITSETPEKSITLTDDQQSPLAVKTTTKLPEQTVTVTEESVTKIPIIQTYTDGKHIPETSTETSDSTFTTKLDQEATKFFEINTKLPEYVTERQQTTLSEEIGSTSQKHLSTVSEMPVASVTETSSETSAPHLISVTEELPQHTSFEETTTKSSEQTITELETTSTRNDEKSTQQDTIIKEQTPPQEVTTIKGPEKATYSTEEQTVTYLGETTSKSPELQTTILEQLTILPIEEQSPVTLPEGFNSEPTDHSTIIEKITTSTEESTATSIPESSTKSIELVTLPDYTPESSPAITDIQFQQKPQTDIPLIHIIGTEGQIKEKLPTESPLSLKTEKQEHSTELPKTTQPSQTEIVLPTHIEPLTTGISKVPAPEGTSEAEDHHTISETDISVTGSPVILTPELVETSSQSGEPEIIYTTSQKPYKPLVTDMPQFTQENIETKKPEEPEQEVKVTSETQTESNGHTQVFSGTSDFGESSEYTTKSTDIYINTHQEKERVRPELSTVMITEKEGFTQKPFTTVTEGELETKIPISLVTDLITPAPDNTVLPNEEGTENPEKTVIETQEPTQEKTEKIPEEPITETQEAATTHTEPVETERGTIVPLTTETLQYVTESPTEGETKTPETLVTEAPKQEILSNSLHTLPQEESSEIPIKTSEVTLKSTEEVVTSFTEKPTRTTESESTESSQSPVETSEGEQPKPTIKEERPSVDQTISTLPVEMHKTTLTGEELPETTESSIISEQLETKTTKLPQDKGTEIPILGTDTPIKEEITASTEVIFTEESMSSTTETQKPIKLDTQFTPSTEKDNGSPQEPTMPEEELISVTTKATTIKLEENVQTEPTTNKFTKTEEKPTETYPSSPTPEPTEEVSEESVPSSAPNGYGQEPEYVDEDQPFGPGTCRYGGKVYVSAQQIPRDDPCDFCFCFRSDIICLQQSCPPPIHGCHEEPIEGFCCPRYECPVSMSTTLNVTTTTTTTTTTLPPHFPSHAYKGAAQRRGCQIKGHTYKVGEVVRASSGPCLHCTCGGDGQMKCDPKVCTPEPLLRQMIAAAVSAKRRR